MANKKQNNNNSFFDLITVSRETEQKLVKYGEVLTKWNAKINLVSPKTIPDLWQRHLLDSAQIIKFISPKALKIADLGTGAGFPAMVLAIIKNDFNLNFETYLVESDTKKCAFLQEVARICEVKNVKIINQRIEAAAPIEADLITARALTNLDDLFNYGYRHITKCGEFMFLKTQNVDNELIEAQKKWSFDYKLESSISDNAGLIIIIKNIEKK